MTTKLKYAISPTREEDYPEWFQQVIKASDMAENAEVRGCMVIKPWGYAIWEKMRDFLDREIKRTGHVNAYFPLFIPLSLLEKEAKHVEGFAKECAVVTHHRLEEKGGKLVPSGELEEPLIVRPTSETIIGECYAKWIESYRDLPLLINQWANVVRWEMRPRIFLRTTEFLWQEGHTVHENEKEALEETKKMLSVYENFAQNVCGVPVIVGEKSEGERFPGAVSTFTIEAMMQDKKALQGGTSHYLGQNFSKAANIVFSTREGGQDFGYTTSWGMTTRMIGSVIMTHGDDDGLRLPPRIAPFHVVIIPVIPDSSLEGEILAFCDLVKEQLSEARYEGVSLDIQVDKRDLRGGEKNWEWIKKGVPLRLEIGPRDKEKNGAMCARRDRPHKDKEFIAKDQLCEQVPKLLSEMQQGYFEQARKFRDENIRRDLQTFEEMKVFFTPKNLDKPEIHGGFVLAKWCGDPATEELLKELKVTIRCLPLEQSGTEGKCIITGKPAVMDAIFAKSY